MQIAIEIFEFYHVDQIQKSRQPNNNLQESISSQVNDQESEICDGKNIKDSVKRHIFLFIASNSHFSLYHGIFPDSNSSYISINVILENRKIDLNELPISFYQDRESFNDHSFNINENFLNTPCFDALYWNGDNSTECCEVIFDDHFDIEDVELSNFSLNLHVPRQTIFENEKNFNSESVPINSHFQTLNHSNNFGIQESIPIFLFL